MPQLDLLTIRKQPARPEPAVSSRVIRAYVKANMRGFAQRQAERERVRKEYQKKNTRRTKSPEPNSRNKRTIQT